ncbi:MAG: hypothetical protein GC159_18615 [Phycisphaera sp.]|nr:hypothetical protein [Phycisphaera sp.]
MPKCRRCTLAVSMLLVVIATSAAHAQKVLAKITVEAGPHERDDTPVAVPLPQGVVSFIDGYHVREGADWIPSQYEPGDKPVLWITLTGATRAGGVRTFELVRGNDPKSPASNVALRRDQDVISLDLYGRPLLQYHYTPVPVPEGVALHNPQLNREAFARSAYIHPVFSPNGLLMTEDFPADHTHHKGLWQAWVHTKWKGRAIDFWNIGDESGTVRFSKFGPSEAGPVFGRFVVEHDHVALPEKKVGDNAEHVVLHEKWDVRAYAAGGPRVGWWMFDITSTQTNVSDAPLLLEQYRYGGMAYRGPRDWDKKDYEILTSAGKTYQDAHQTAAAWCMHSGKVGGKDVSMLLMCHPDNDRFPENMRTSGGFGPFFNWAPIQTGPWTWEPGATHVFRYRFLIHESGIDKSFAEQHWAAFGDPPKVKVELAK